MDPITLYAIAQGGTSLAKYFGNRYFNKNRPSFTGSAYGKFLKKLQQGGVYDARARNIIQGNVNRQSANVVDAAKANYMGRMVNRGNVNSISNQRAFNEMDKKRADINAQTARDISLRNELSKVNAGERYAQLAYQDRLSQQDLKRQNLTELVGGLGGAVGSYALGKLKAGQKPTTLMNTAIESYQQHDDPAKFFADLVSAGFSKDEALQIMRLMLNSGGPSLPQGIDWTKIKPAQSIGTT